MSDHELLLAISNIFVQQVEPLKQNMQELKEDVQELKQDVSELQEDMQEVKRDVQELKQGVSGLEEEQHTINILIENEIKSDMRLLVDNFLPAARKYGMETDRMDKLETRVDLLENVVTEHSGILQKIS